MEWEYILRVTYYTYNKVTTPNKKTDLFS